ncbi:MAG: bifunctional alpha,alpha-trehalose-phosphate synthase (UDP-forming)/trehalose-phosphatase [Dehalococcoidia bacterium]|nr:bifunctional alpha,alpha-trehalose-phosphate synthase (UDP-forming)/trehalose-phosphatase [Dehalococcoidia bacterium]
MRRLVIVSNRLPATIQMTGQRARFEPSVGGLATGLDAAHRKGNSIWIGWPGAMDAVREGQRPGLERWLSERRLIPVNLTASEVERHYEGYANRVLWPLFHYFPERLPLEGGDWDAYESVNRRFADVVARELQDGDVVWIQDYQLLRLPALLRKRVPDVPIGFFLHIPFPSSELFALLPQREQLLEGMLGADLIGFHTAAYQRHFSSAALRFLGAQTQVDRISHGGREVQVGAFPMGIDVASFAGRAEAPEVQALAAHHRAPDTQNIVGIDRADYTKGIVRRLMAFRDLLERHPELRGQVRMIQVGVPSREQVSEYRTHRRRIEELVGRINGEFGTSTWTPVQWIARALPRDEVVSLYAAADVMAVTPLRDGMNLVAKEFVASRVDNEGVLVLSEFSGAAAELAEAVQVNPFDIERTSAALYGALTMPFEERQSRMSAMRTRIEDNTLNDWVDRFLGSLERRMADRRREQAAGPVPLPDAVVTRMAEAESLVLLLDYDGTLVPLARAPSLAQPSAGLLEMLRTLVETRGTEVHVATGRSPELIERWLGHLPVSLYAEHGAWSRPAGSLTWVGRPLAESTWREPALRMLHDYAKNTPGALVEEKRLGVAWHYRWADPEIGALRSRELRSQLTDLLSNTGAEILHGDRVIEVRPAGISKALVVESVLLNARPGALMVALGDDRTDEEMFGALPPGAVSVHLGSGPSRARYRLSTVAAARELLADLTRRRAVRGEPRTPRETPPESDDEVAFRSAAVRAPATPTTVHLVGPLPRRPDSAAVA